MNTTWQELLEALENLVALHIAMDETDESDDATADAIAIIAKAKADYTEEV